MHTPHTFTQTQPDSEAVGSLSQMGFFFSLFVIKRHNLYRLISTSCDSYTISCEGDMGSVVASRQAEGVISTLCLMIDHLTRWA